MTNHVMLDNINHKDLRVITNRSEALGDKVSFTHVFPSEFRHLQGQYPLFFRKSPSSGEFEIIALFGFDNNENLFLNNLGWQASYIPLTIERQPFLIGFQTNNAQGVDQQNSVVHIDMDSPRISETSGEKVFLPQGGNSDYLQHISGVLQQIHQGHEDNKALVEALLAADLIESTVINIELVDGSKLSLDSLYAIHEEKLAALTGDQLSQLHGQGFLQLAHFMLASISNLSTLIDKKNNSI